MRTFAYALIGALVLFYDLPVGVLAGFGVRYVGGPLWLAVPVGAVVVAENLRATYSAWQLSAASS